MKLYGVPLSPFVRKVIFLLNELALPFESIELPPQSDNADFRHISPLGRIPAFSDGAFEMADSAAINRYLVMRENSDLMGGVSAQVQARIVRWETFADDDLAPALLNPLIERVVKPVRLGQPTDEGSVTEAIQKKLPRVYTHLETTLEGNTAWLAGETFSYADIAVGAHMATAELAGVAPTSDEYPRLAAWHEKLGARPAYRAMIDRARDYIARADQT